MECRVDGGHELSISGVFLITATLDRNQLLGPLEVILHSANPRTAFPPPPPTLLLSLRCSRPVQTPSPSLFCTHAACPVGWDQTSSHISVHA